MCMCVGGKEGMMIGNSLSLSLSLIDVGFLRSRSSGAAVTFGNRGIVVVGIGVVVVVTDIMSMDNPLRSPAGPGLSGLLGRNALPILSFFLYFRRVWWSQGSGRRWSSTSQQLLLLLKIGRGNLRLW
jgi:hypothetical protein